MAVGKRVYVATCFIRVGDREFAPGDKVSDGDAALKGHESYFEAVGVEAVEEKSKTAPPAKK